MPGRDLTREEARARAHLLAVNAYEIALDLSNAPEGGTFWSSTVVRFTAAVPGASSFIDLVAPSVHEVVLNGEALDPAQVYAANRITLPSLAAENELRVVADCAYSSTGEGLHRFVDPVDGHVYLYTQFEVADARRVFAAFDQPDLKSTFQFSVTAPAGWKVISNEVVAASGKGKGEDTELHRFAPTPRLSTYVTALIAGPYVSVFDTYADSGGRRLPLGIFCRPSLAEHLDAEAIFDITKQGLDYFQEKFGSRYPFTKYDQLFVPEFNAGAMENAGAVTLRDQYLFRSRVTDAAYEFRANTILHELAHMWFGDLVTMEWWDDLWLNESFATFTSVLCQADAPGSRWPHAWTTFANSMKSAAYRQDQLPSTHPIVAEINDLGDVQLNFDGITYHKGASVLKQLVAYVGQEAFFAGVQAYMKRHAWGNTTLANLLDALEETSGRKLKEWSGYWLETVGINVLRAEFEVADGKVDSLAIRQEAPDLPAGARGKAILRPHRIAIGMYDLVDGALTRIERVELDVTGELTTVPLTPGQQRPAVILVNDDDLSYAKVRLDAESLATVTAHIADFTEPLPRALCWASAWDMTRDGELAIRDYMKLVLSGIGCETDIGVVQLLQRQLKQGLELYADPGWREDGLAWYADQALEQLHLAVPGSDHQLAWARAFAAVARTDANLAILRRILDGTDVIPGLQVDADLRWALLERLSAVDAEGSSAVDAELERDKTAAGQRHAATCLAARPTAEAKAEAWASVVEAETLTNALQEAVIIGFVQPDQRELLKPYTAKYFDAIKDIFAQRSHEMAQQIIVGLYPSLQVEQATLDATDEWLASADPAPALRRTIIEARAGVQRALRAQSADRAASGR